MKTVSVKLSQVKVNAANPRTITDSKFQKLIDSLLAFPKMLEIRPIVVDNTMTALGGNMRLRALVSIADMDEAALTGRLMGLKDVKKKPQAERDALLQYWLSWRDKQEVAIVKASELSEDEQRQFIIKDNASFGQWDYDALANTWDATDLNNWGVDVWANAQPVTFPTGQTMPTPSAVASGGGLDESGLPPELQGMDLIPDELLKIEGTDETPCERIIITYRKEEVERVAAFCGLDKIAQVVYEFKDLPAAKKTELCAG